MFQQFYPKEDYMSVYEIPFEEYYRKGYRGILFDVDNTLVEHDQPATPRAKALFRRLRQIGFATCLISNNKDFRVRPFADAVGSSFVHKAGKPSPRGYQEGMKRMRTARKATLFVGDQLFTDVWGANRAGIHSILVKQIARHEEIQIILKRQLERIVLWAYRRQGKRKPSRRRHHIKK